MSLRNGPLSFCPSKKCPLLSKCPFNKIERTINYNVNLIVFEIENVMMMICESVSEGEDEGKGEW